MVGGGLSIEECPPVSHKSASRLVFKKKGTSAESRNPFEYCDGAEGGTRTPTGFPTTPAECSFTVASLRDRISARWPGVGRCFRDRAAPLARSGLRRAFQSPRKTSRSLPASI